MTSAPVDSPAPVVAHSRRWWTLATVALAQLMVVLDATVVNIALPAAQADLGFSDGDRQWIITAYSLAFGSLLLLGGRLSDLWGRKRTFIIGLIGFAAASALGGAAPTFGVLVAARALQGAFGALLAPTALAVLTTTFTIPRERARAFGVFGAIAGAGGAIGLLLGGFLTENFDWRWNLYVNVFIALIAFVGALLFVRHVARTGPRPKLDLPGTVLVSAALFLLVYGFSNAETEGWDSPLTWGMLAASAVLLVGFVLWQRARRPPAAAARDRARPQPRRGLLSVLIAGRRHVRHLPVRHLLPADVARVLADPDRPGVPADDRSCWCSPRSCRRTSSCPRLRPEGHGAARHGASPPRGMVCLTHLDAAEHLRGRHPAAAHDHRLRHGLDHARVDADGHARRRPSFAGVASAMVNTSQQVGGSIGTALLNTLAATAATDYVAAHTPPTEAVLADAAIHSYAVAYWWGAGFFAVRRGARGDAVPSSRRRPVDRRSRARASPSRHARPRLPPPSESRMPRCRGAIRGGAADRAGVDGSDHRREELGLGVGDRGVRQGAPGAGERLHRGIRRLG